MISEDNLMDLPDDPELAFVALEEKIRKLTNQSVDQADNASWEPYYIQHINQILAAKSALGLNILDGWRVSDRSGDVIGIFNSLTSDVDHFTMQVKIVNARRKKLYSVALDSRTKEEIRDYISKIRVIIDTLEISERKREALHKKLSMFQDEIDRSRTKFDVYASFAIEVAEIGKETGDKLNFLKDWLDAVGRLIGRADSEEKAQKSLPSPELAKRLEPPISKVHSYGRKTSPDPLPSPKRPLDDEIPF